METINEIKHISDTALWIAAYRAQETERLDAAFKDPFAGMLAGEHGRKIAAAIPHTEAMAFAMIVRTSAIDRLINMAVDKGIDTVINLGAGLDTRPYRMQLPPDLNWIEVDFENVLDYKQEQLKDSVPVCRLERVALDLSDVKKREAYFNIWGDKAKNALVITEGLIGYLSNEEAASLSYHLRSVNSFRYWIMDYSQGKLRSNRQSKKVSKQLVNAPLKFKEADPLAFFRSHGWRVDENIHILDEADRIGRAMPPFFPWTFLMKLFPRKIREIGNNTYGYVMFERQENY